MGEATSVDFAAVGRVSRFTDLENVRLTALTAKCDPSTSGRIEAQLTHNCSVTSRDSKFLEVEAIYHFIGRSGEVNSIDMEITYLLVYTLNASEALADSDVSEFASANGTLHSWPFVREVLNGMTSRMGFPPFNLGVMHFVSPPSKPVQRGDSVGE